MRDLLLEEVRRSVKIAFPEVGDDPEAIDEAMKLGYNWAQGPFEMIDEIGVDEFCQIVAEEDPPAPAFLEAAAGRSFYRAEGGRLEQLGTPAGLLAAPGSPRVSELLRAPTRQARMVERLLADADTPTPGGPTMRRLCPPAAATSSARFP